MPAARPRAPPALFSPSQAPTTRKESARAESSARRDFLPPEPRMLVSTRALTTHPASTEEQWIVDPSPPFSCNHLLRHLATRALCIGTPIAAPRIERPVFLLQSLTCLELRATR
jgi:hypothetical protein